MLIVLREFPLYLVIEVLFVPILKPPNEVLIYVVSLEIINIKIYRASIGGIKSFFKDFLKLLESKGIKAF